MDIMDQILAIVTITSFAIQRVLEIIDPLITRLLKNPKNTKRAVMALLATGLGGIVVGVMDDLTLLGLIQEAWKRTWLDKAISALVIGAGTEGLNIVTKYLDYLKKARKAMLSNVAVEIIPATQAVAQGTNLPFQAKVTNSENQDVSWAVSKGAITQDGVYTSPSTPGPDEVVAISQADPTKHAIAKVTVTQ